MSISKSVKGFSDRKIKIARFFLRIIGKCSKLIDYIYPKDDSLIFFGSNTGEYPSGSPNSFFKYINHYATDNFNRYNDLNKWKTFYYLPFAKGDYGNSYKTPKNPNLFSSFKYILFNSHKFFKSKYLVSSHPLNDFFPFDFSDRKILINLWHGTPIKSLFYADEGENDGNLKEIDRMVSKTDIFTVSSKLEKNLIKKCFHISDDKIFLTGHPRNDFIEFNISNSKQDYKKNKLGEFLDISVDYDKIILYSPTYRRESETKFFPFCDIDFKKLNEFLNENKMIILIRGHVYQSEYDNEMFSERIVDLGFDVCNDVNEILPCIDLLITDYSSIYIDYLILNRPCMFIQYDKAEYISSRGLLFDDDSWMAGYDISNFKDFLNALEDISNNEDPFFNERKRVIDMFHELDGNSSINLHDNSSIRILKLIQRVSK